MQKVEPGAFTGVEIAFCSAGTAQSREYSPMIVKAGATVIDKSNAFRMDPAVPLVVPEINPEAARTHQGILACPNCTTIVTVMPLKPCTTPAACAAWWPRAISPCRARESTASRISVSRRWRGPATRPWSRSTSPTASPST
jgi:hypothetical protein